MSDYEVKPGIKWWNNMNVEQMEAVHAVIEAAKEWLVRPGVQRRIDRLTEAIEALQEVENDEPYMTLRKGHKLNTFSWSDSESLSWERWIPREGPISHSGMTVSAADAIVVIRRLLSEGFALQEPEGE